MSPLRARMIEDMSFWPDWPKERRKSTSRQCADWPLITVARADLCSTREEVRGLYLLGLRQRGVARRVTFQTSRFGLRFFYHHTLEACMGTVRGKKGSPRHGRNGCLRHCPEDQIRQLLGSITQPGSTRTCLALMYACGLRISEATTLEVGAIDRANVRCSASSVRVTRSGWCRCHGRSSTNSATCGAPGASATAAGCSPIDAPATHPISKRVLSETFACAAEAARGPAPGDPAHPAPLDVRDQADRERRQHSHRADPAGPLQHRIHRHLHPSHHAHPGIALHGLLDRLMTGL